MEVFENTTRHHVISKGIRELVYDGSLFQNDMTISDYFWHLYCILGIITIGLKSEPFNCMNNEINAFIADYRNQAITHRKLYRRHVRDKFIVEGHKNYKNYAEFERHGLGNRLFLSRLCGGLRRLDSLRSVISSSSLWTYDLYENQRTGSSKPITLHGPKSGPPLVRSWHPLHLRPFHWKCEEMDNERSLICEHFYTMTAAVSETHQKMKSLKIPYGEL